MMNKPKKPEPMSDYLNAGRAHDERFERLFAPWNQPERDRDLDYVECYGCNTYVPMGAMELDGYDGKPYCADCAKKPGFIPNNQDQ